MLKNYYQILDLDRYATKEEIKKAYHLYAIKFHPDKQDGDKFFEERFKEVKGAYDILIDAHKREKYDSQFFGNSERLNSSESGTQNDFSPKQHKTSESVIYKKGELLITSNKLIYKGEEYDLRYYKGAEVQKIDKKNYYFYGFFYLLLGIISIPVYIGWLFIFVGLYFLLIYKYALHLTDYLETKEFLFKGRRNKLRFIVRKLDEAMGKISGK